MQWLLFALLCARSIFECNAAETSMVHCEGPNDEATEIGRALDPVLTGQTGFDRLLKPGQSGLILGGAWKFVVVASTKTTTRDHFSRMTVSNTIHVYSKAKLFRDPHALPTYVLSHNGEFINVLERFDERSKAKEHVFVGVKSIIKVEYIELNASTSASLPASTGQKEAVSSSGLPFVTVTGSTDEARAIGKALSPLFLHQTGFQKLLLADRTGSILGGAWKYIVVSSSHTTSKDHCSEMTVRNTIHVYSSANLATCPSTLPIYTVVHEGIYNNVLQNFSARAQAKEHEFTLGSSQVNVASCNLSMDKLNLFPAAEVKQNAVPSLVEVDGLTDEARAIGEALVPLLLGQNGFKKLLPVNDSGLLLDGAWKFILKARSYSATRDNYSKMTVSSTVTVYSSSTLCADPSAPPTYTVSYEAHYENVLTKFEERAQASEQIFTVQRGRVTVKAIKAVASKPAPIPASPGRAARMPHAVTISGDAAEAEIIGGALAPFLREQNGFKKLLRVGHRCLIPDSPWGFIVRASGCDAALDQYAEMTVVNTISVFSTASFFINPHAPPAYIVFYEAVYDNVLTGYEERADAEEQTFNFRAATIWVDKP